MKSLVAAIQFDRLVKNLAEISNADRLINAYNAVREIPYGGTRSDEPEMILENQRGTGRGKHGLLKSLLSSIGYESQEFLAKHNLGIFPIDPWPEALREFRGASIPSYHDFLKVKIGDRFVTVDATFDSFLTTIGFPALAWDGKSDMRLPVEAEEIIPVTGEMGDQMRQLVHALPNAERARRQSFLKAMKTWIEEERRKNRGA